MRLTLSGEIKSIKLTIENLSKIYYIGIERVWTNSVNRKTIHSEKKIKKKKKIEREILEKNMYPQETPGNSTASPLLANNFCFFIKRQ